MENLQIKGSMTVRQLQEQFAQVFGGTLRVYKVDSVDSTLASVSGKGNVEDWNCPSNITVAAFNAEMLKRFSLKVKIGTVDDWVIVLDDIRLEQIKLIKKSAVKADMMALLINTPSESKIDVPHKEKEVKLEPIKKEEVVENTKLNVVDNSTLGKVRVYGKAQNRTVLGIVNAYLVMYPHATLEDLNKAFPGSLNSAKRYKDLFIDLSDTSSLSQEHLNLFFFEKEDEIITLSNGQRIAMLELWDKNDFLKIVNWAKQYEIIIADFQPKQGFRKGGYTLEYLNGYVPPKPSENKSKKWLWILLALLVVVGVLLAVLLTRKPETQVVEKVVTVVDTVYIQQLEEIESNFNAVQFEKGKSDLKDEAKFVLHDLAKLMEKHEEINISIEGHTSAEGDSDFNKKLSEDRAKAAVDFLINRGISQDRLEFKGFGSSKLKNEQNPMAPENRRTEFILK